MGNFSQVAERKLDSDVLSSKAAGAAWDNWSRGWLIFKTAPQGCSAVMSSVPDAGVGGEKAGWQSNKIIRHK